MSPELLFRAANLFALVGWAVLIAGVLMQRDWLRDRLPGLYWPVVLSLAYVIAVAVGLSTNASGGFSSLPAVRQLFASDWALLGGWVHYLAFDLFVGTWIARETAHTDMSRFWLVPILPLTFLFGPAGFLLFQIVRIASQRR
jgi:hypothetical protein